MTVPAEVNKTHSSLYEADFFAWVEQQSLLLKQGRLEELDLVNLIEEVEGLSRSDKRALKSQVIRVLKHLLKLNYQPNAFYYLNSWRSSVAEGRSQIKLILQDSPSLKPYLEQVFAECYQNALEEAVAETGLSLSKFPRQCPYLLEKVLDVRFWPGDSSSE